MVPTTASRQPPSHIRRQVPSIPMVIVAVGPSGSGKLYSHSSAVAMAKEEEWEYSLPEPEGPTATITIGMDGTCLRMCEGGWREAVVGTIGLYEWGGEAR